MTNIIISSETIRINMNVEVDNKKFASISSVLCNKKKQLLLTYLTKGTTAMIEEFKKVSEPYWNLVIDEDTKVLMEIIDLDKAVCGTGLMTLETPDAIFESVLIDGKIEIVGR